jgi:pimeloyl-ACP methyl ester carboxylesterase
LRTRNIPHAAINLEPLLGSIDHYASLIDAAVREVHAATGLAPIVVAHSMGGVATRAWMDAQRADDRIHRVVTIGTPHRGTVFGRYAVSTNARQMDIASEWLLALAMREPPQRYRRFTCFYSNCDNIVLPSRSATLPGADNRHLAGCPHVYMAFQPEIFNEVLRLASTRAIPPLPDDAAAR